ncbi:MAG: ATP-binding cassette domain-containing protein [Pseudomonadota bacterium]
MACKLSVQSLKTSLIGPISFEVGENETLCIKGETGSGKTLLLRAIADLDFHEGLVVLNGREQAEFHPPDWRRRVGLLPAESAWWSEIVEDHFSDPDAVGKFGFLGFDRDVFDWPVSRLSSGERQRLALLRLLNQEPEVLLLDEPTANIDNASTLEVESLIERYRKKTGAAVIWVSHSASQRMRVASRVLDMVDGKLVS